MKILAPLALILCCILGSCKTDTSPANHELDDMAKAKATLEANPNMASAEAYLIEIRKKIAAGANNRKELLEEGLAIAEHHKMGPAAITYLMPLAKEYHTDPAYPDWIAKLASALYDLKKEAAGEVLAQAYFNKYPSGQFVKSLQAKVGMEIPPVEKQLTALAEGVFVEPDKYGINRANAQKYVDACEAFALGYPDSDEAPSYLYKGAEMARTLRTFNKALSIYEWISEKYPDYEKTPTTVFLKGFMLENEMNDKERAREVYSTFLVTYPNHELADDIQFLLDNIDKSDQQIMEMIEKKKK